MSGMNRRTFLWHVGGGTLGVALGSCGAGGDSASSRGGTGDTVPAFQDLPKIDIHAHYFVDMPGLAEMLRGNHLRAINVCAGATDRARARQMEQIAAGMFRRYGSLFPFCCTFDLTGRDATDYHTRVTGELDASFAAGAGVGKIWKEVGP